MARTAKRTRTTRKPKVERRRPDVFVAEVGANRETDWTPLPPDEKSRYQKYVTVVGGDYEPEVNSAYPDSVRVTISESDPDGLAVHLTIYGRGATDGGDSGDFEGIIFPDQARHIYAALGAAIEQAEKIGILLPASSNKQEVRVAPFAYTGERGAAGKWLGWGDKLRKRARSKNGKA